MIPIATTTISVLTGTEPEPGEGLLYTITDTGVRAVIGSPSGAESVAPGGGRAVINLKLTCDPCTITHMDRVTDEQTGETFEVSWPQARQGLGLDHVTAGLKSIIGIMA